MKKIILIIYILFISKIHCQENSVFWKIQKDSAISYILGTCHIYGKSYVEKDKIIFAALKSSSVVFLENIGTKDSIFNSRTTFDYIDKFSMDEKKTLDEITGNINFNKLTIRELFVYTDNYLHKKFCLKHGYGREKIKMESFIENYALKEKKRVMGLEKKCETLNYIATEFLKDVDETKIFGSVKYKLNELSKGNSIKNCLTDELYNEKKCKYDLASDVNNILLYIRNKKWIIKILEELENNNTIFIAVGLGHLDYKTGLISLLREKGYVVTPIDL